MTFFITLDRDGKNMQLVRHNGKTFQVIRSIPVEKNEPRRKD